MQELDLWCDANIIGPLSSTDPKGKDWGIVTESVRNAIRTKVLESYHNGQKAGVTAPTERPVRKEWRK